MNTDIFIPDINCPVPDNPKQGYYTDEQSNLNVAREDRFRLILDIPNLLKPALRDTKRVCNAGNFDRLELSVWGYLIPEITIPKIEKAWGGQTFKASSLSRNSYPSVNVNFTVDNRFDNYFILWKWLDLLNDEEHGGFNTKNPNHVYAEGYLPDYSTTITIQSLDEFNNEVPTAEWHFFGSFITNIGAINARQRSGAEIESSFSFDFSQLKMNLI